MEGDPTFFPDHFPCCIIYFSPFYQNDYVCEKFELFCCCPLDMIWEFVRLLPTKIILLGTFIHFWSSTSVQVFLVYFVCLYVFLYDKINYIVLRTESEVIPG